MFWFLKTKKKDRQHRCVVVCGRGDAVHPNLAEENGHEVIVDEEGLWEARVVEVEEERGEAQRDVLLRRGAEGGAQQLHACHRDEQSSAARWGEKGRTLSLTHTGLLAEMIRYQTPKPCMCFSLTENTLIFTSQANTNTLKWWTFKHNLKKVAHVGMADPLNSFFAHWFQHREHFPGENQQ